MSFFLRNKNDTLQDLDIMTHDSCRDSLVALLSTREQSHIPIPNLAQLRYVVVRSLEFFFYWALSSQKQGIAPMKR